MAMHSRYECGDNFFKVDVNFCASPGVPISGNNIKKMVEFYFPQPGPLPVPMHIAVPDTNPQPPLHSTSPIEVRFAVLRAVARDVTANDQARLLQWRQILLSVHFRYILLDTADKIWRAGRQFREDVAQAYVTMRVSVLQNIYEVVHFRRKHDRLRENIRKGLGRGVPGGDDLL